MSYVKFLLVVSQKTAWENISNDLFCVPPATLSISDDATMHHSAQRKPEQNTCM